jgi:hypothetical protein
LLDYYQKLWTQQSKDNTTEGKREELKGNRVNVITMEELETNIKALKTRKSAGSDGINNELYKQAPKVFYINILIFKIFVGFMGTFLTNGGQLLLCGDIPDEWWAAIVLWGHS